MDTPGMSQTFKAKNELVGILLFAGSIGIFVFSIYNMGYRVPTYLWIAIALIIPLAIWVMAATSYGIKDEKLIIQSGPFRNAISIKEINSLERKEIRRAGGRKQLDQLNMVYKENRRMTLLPIEREAMIVALQAVNPAIVVK